MVMVMVADVRAFCNDGRVHRKPWGMVVFIPSEDTLKKCNNKNAEYEKKYKEK